MLTNKWYKKAASIMLSASMLYSNMFNNGVLTIVNAETSEDVSLKTESPELRDTVSDRIPSLSYIQSHDDTVEPQSEKYRYSILPGTTVSLKELLLGAGFFTEEDADSYFEKITAIRVDDSGVISAEETEEGWTISAADEFKNTGVLQLEIDGQTFDISVTNRTKEPSTTVFIEKDGVTHTGNISVHATDGDFSESVELNAGITTDRGDLEKAVSTQALVYADFLTFDISANEERIGYEVDFAFPVPVKGNDYFVYRVDEGEVIKLDGSVDVSDEEGALGVKFTTDKLGSFVFAYTKDFDYYIEEAEYNYSLTTNDNVSLRTILIESGVIDEDYANLLIANITSVSSENAGVLTVETIDDTCVVVPQQSFESVVLNVQTASEQIVPITIIDAREDSSETKKAAISSPNDEEIELVTITPTNNEELPEEAESHAEVVDGTTAIEAVEEHSNTASENTEYKVFDIDLENVDSDEYESFDVELQLSKKAAIYGSNFKLFHVKEGGFVEEIKVNVTIAVDEDGNEIVEGLSFTTPSFSQFVLVYTINESETDKKIFTWNAAEGQTISLSDLLVLLDIKINPLDISYIDPIDGGQLTINRNEETSDWIIGVQEVFTDPKSITIHLNNNDDVIVINVTASEAFTITWVNYDDTVLKQDEFVPAESLPTYTGDTPYKPETQQYTYRFKGWDPAVVKVTADVTYKALFEEEIRKYEITWINWNGEVLYKDKFEYGAIPVYSHDDPTRSGDSDHAYYAFDGWKENIVPVTGDATYTAKYVPAALELYIREQGSSGDIPVPYATFTMTNEDDIVVWTGTTSNSGKLFISKVSEETRGCGGATFAVGKKYVIEQEGQVDGFIKPAGSWLLTVDGTDDAPEYSMVRQTDVTPDYSTIAPDGPYSTILFFISLAKQAYIDFDYNYPADIEGEPEKEHIPLDFLSYNKSYTIEKDPGDLSSYGYESVGWVDNGNRVYKKGASKSLNTINAKLYTMTAKWRVPLSMDIATFSGGSEASPEVVDGSDGIFSINIDPQSSMEQSKVFTDLSVLGLQYGEQKEEAAPVTGGSAFEFSYATLKLNDDRKITVTGINYDAAEHVWRYRAEGATEWVDLPVGAHLSLVYIASTVKVKWVKEAADGSFSQLDALLPEKNLSISSNKWTSAEDLFKSLMPDNSNARMESIIEGDCFFHYFGLGGNVDNTGGLIKGEDAYLQNFELKNSNDGIIFRKTSSEAGDVLSGMSTIYLVYAENLPRGSVRFDIENNTSYSYQVNSLMAGNVNLIDNHKAVLVKDTGLLIFDNGSNADKHINTTINSKTVANLVLLDSQSKSFTLNGGFNNIASAPTSYTLNVGIASFDQFEIKRRIAVKTDLSNTGNFTRGTLDSTDGKTIVSFTEDHDSSFAISKKWSDDVDPTNYKADVELYEVYKGTNEELPTSIPLTDKQSGFDIHEFLRGQGYIVLKALNSNGFNNYYTVDRNNSWTLTIPNLPDGLAYYAVESSIREGSDNTNLFERFKPTYNVDINGKTELVMNQRSDPVCQVGDQQFPTIKDAVSYITSNSMTTATIEMLQDYIIPSGGVFEIPSEYNITLTSLPNTAATIRRGFNGGDMISVKGSLSLSNITISGKVRNTQYQNEGNGGLIVVYGAGILTVDAESVLCDGKAKNGSAVYVDDEGTVEFNGGKVQNNTAITGGAIGFGGLYSRINISGKTYIYNNRRENSNAQYNIYLDQDSSEIIHVNSPGLDETATIGVYVPDTNKQHGLPAKDFATYTSDNNLNRFINDRFSSTSPSRNGYISELLPEKVVWGETFSFTVDIQWLDDHYEKINSPASGSVQLTLIPVNNSGSVTDDNLLTVSVSADTQWSHEFKGLAKYSSNGEPAKYQISESNIVPEEYERITFYGDRGTGESKYPFEYIEGAGNSQRVFVSNKKKLTSFTITKETKGLNDEDTLSSTYIIKGIRKYGVGSLYDLPNGLRRDTFPLAWKKAESYEDTDSTLISATMYFFTICGGNTWYCQTSDHYYSGAELKKGIELQSTIEPSLVKFHKFYDLSKEQDSPDFQKGDVKFENGNYSVFIGNGEWFELEYIEDQNRPDVRIDYTRQDGYEGADSAGAGYQQMEVRNITLRNKGNQLQTMTLSDLSSSFYYYAIESSVVESGSRSRTINTLPKLVAAYDPKYEYNQAEQKVKVTNNRRDVLAVYKQWDGDATPSVCTFSVYKVKPKVAGQEISLEDADLFKGLVTELKYSTVDIQKVPALGFSLRKVDTGSWVHVITIEDLMDLIEKGELNEDDLNAVYFAREDTVNGVVIENHDVNEDDYNTDAVYSYTDDVKLLTVKNLGDVLCKIVDNNGVEHVFRSLKAAYKYGTTRPEEEGAQDEFTIEMLRDYNIPSNDVLTIENGKKVTLTTATTGDYRYRGKDHAKITRGTANTAFFTVSGSSDNIADTKFTITNLSLISNSSTQVTGNGSLITGTKATISVGDEDYSGNSYDVTLSGGNANNYGGSIYVKNGDIKIHFTKIENSKAGAGGAIFADTSNLNINVASFEKCESTTTNTNFGGGAIFTNMNSYTSSYCEFIECKAVTAGGAIFHNNKESGSETNVEHSTFTKCVTTGNNNDQCGGGAVASTAVKLTINGEGNRFSECTTQRSGGAVFHNNGTSEAKTTVNDATFEKCVSYSNTDKQSTGGVLTKAPSLTLANDEFSECVATKQGGAVFQNNNTNGTLTVDGSRFISCKTNGTASAAGAIESDVQNVTVLNSYFENCSATTNGGALNFFTANNANPNVTSCVSVRNSEFIDCSALKFGGAVRSTAKTTEIINCIFSKLSDDSTGCKGENGGAVYAQNSNNGSTTTITGSTFNGCSTTSGSGGAVYTLSTNVEIAANNSINPKTGKETKQPNTFVDCLSKSNGGAVYHSNTATGGSLSISDTSFERCSTNNTGDNRFGGAVYTDTNELKLLNEVSFEDCFANASGGGIYYSNTNGTINISNSSFNLCSVSKNNGGGIFTKAKLVVIGKTPFSDCSALKGDGGALFIDNSKCTLNIVDNSNFENCHSYGVGGAICSNGLITTVADSNFINCSTSNSADGNRGGGAIRTSGSSEIDNTLPSTTIARSTFKNCTSGRNGGAIYTDNYILTIESNEASPGESTLYTFDGCTALDQGGAIRHSKNDERAEIILRNCTFNKCESINAGGGISTNAHNVTITNNIFNECTSVKDVGGGAIASFRGSKGSSITVSSSSFDNCKTTENSAGAIYSVNHKLTINNKTSFTNCFGTKRTSNSDGGAIYHNPSASSSVTEISDCEFENCYSIESQGGAILSKADEAHFLNSKFRECWANTWGGAINHNGETKPLTSVINCEFVNCHTNVNMGGALRSDTLNLQCDTVLFQNCHSDGDNTDSGGGAISFGTKNINASASIKNSRFIGNYCHENRKGGAINNRSGNLSIENITIDGTLSNRSIKYNAHDGAGIFSDLGTVMIGGTNNTIKNCSSKVSGGAIYLGSQNNKSATIQNIEIINNIADSTTDKTGGGGIYFAPANVLTLDNCVIKDNISGAFGGGVYFNSEKNLIILNNTSITGNTIKSTLVENGAGLYMIDKSTLIFGDAEHPNSSNTFTIYDNKTSSNQQSNLRIMLSRIEGTKYKNMNGNNPDIILYSNLTKPSDSTSGFIGVCTPGYPGTQFGLSNPENHSGVEYFISDDNTMHGQIDENDKKLIIWYKAPVCQITDDHGNLLSYGDGVNKTSAIFFSLTEALNAFNNKSSGYFNEEPKRIEMLVENYELEAGVPDWKRSGTLTTRDGLPICTITRGKNTKGTMFTISYDVAMTVSNIKLDGGSQKDLSSNSNGGIIRALETSSLILDRGAVLQNSSVKGWKDGGAVYVDGGAEIRLTRNSRISSCSADRSGGAVYLSSGAVMRTEQSPTINNCEASLNGGAVYVSDYAEMHLCSDLSDSPIIAGNSVIHGNGAGIYLGTEGKIFIMANPQFENAGYGKNLKSGMLFNQTNGGEVYEQARQDIYLAMDTRNALSNIVIQDSIRSGEGAIWVWSDSIYHNRIETQFAIRANSSMTNEDSFKAFRNAQTDSVSENENDSYLYGVLGEDGKVYWSGIEGKVLVLLRKVQEKDKTERIYAAPTGTITFEILKNGKIVSLKKDDGSTIYLNQEYLKLQKNGVFFYGELPYGQYELVEHIGGITKKSNFFVNENGLVFDKNGKDPERYFVLN